jgi:hypothetical protein
LSVLSKQILMIAGLIALPITVRPEKVANAKPIPAKPPQQPISPNPDPRTVRLQKFLLKLHCPVAPLAEDFVHAADDNQLDWRLLPSISVIESGGGKAYRNNNLFGWDQGDGAFPTLRAGLNEVAFKLGRSSLYRNRTNLEKLRAYNPDATYAGKVLTVMNRISPVVNLRPVERVFRSHNQYVYATE